MFAFILFIIVWYAPSFIFFPRLSFLLLSSYSRLQLGHIKSPALLLFGCVSILGAQQLIQYIFFHTQSSLITLIFCDEFLYFSIREVSNLRIMCLGTGKCIYDIFFLLLFATVGVLKMSLAHNAWCSIFFLDQLYKKIRSLNPWNLSFL